MRLKSFTIFIINVALCSFIIQLSACGTLMYPERRGHKAGEIDVKVAVLDGLGLLFFIIPGVVAYIVDFDTGAIYLPSGKRNMLKLEDGDIKTIKVDRNTLRDEKIVREIVTRECGLPSVVNWNRLEKQPLSAAHREEMMVRLADL